MSVITDAVIICMREDDESIAKVNKLLVVDDPYREQQFHKMDNSASGGNKFPSLTTYQACFNYMSTDVILEAFHSADWDSCYHSAVLLMDDEFDVHYTYAFCKGNKYHHASKYLPDCHSM